MKAILKEVHKGFVLCADAELVYFIYHLHLTAMGIVDILHLYKSPHLIFNSSFQPHL
jgi:hypothetical protein